MTRIESSLSAAQQGVLKHLLNGLGNKEIAELLQISDKTVKNHLSNILRRTATTSRLELTVKVYKARERMLKRRLRAA